MSETHGAREFPTFDEFLNHLDEEHWNDEHFQAWEPFAPRMQLTIRSADRNVIAMMRGLTQAHAEELVSEWIQAGVGNLAIELTHEV